MRFTRHRRRQRRLEFIRLHLDGGSSNIYYRTIFGSGSWTAKAFEIDHPLDPENKILRHFCLEGPQVWNVYAGNAQLVNGQAVVELPEYYSVLNLVGSEIYSLTPISSDLQIAVIKQEVIDNHRMMKESELQSGLSAEAALQALQPGQAAADNQAGNTIAVFEKQ